MPPNEKDKLNRIEELKNKLFTKNYQPKTGRLDDFSRRPASEVQSAWQKDGATADPKAKFGMKRSSVFKKFFIFSIIFFVLALGYGAYIYFSNGNTVSNNNIDIAVLGNTFTTGGADFPMVINVTNRNTAPLQAVDLVIEYPSGSTTDADGGTERIRDSLGDIPAGGTKSQSEKIVLYGEEGTQREVDISIEYRVAGSNAIFVKEKPYDVTITTSPINLSVDAPSDVSPNQSVTLHIKETLNSDKPSADMLVQVDYPFGFQFTSATPKPSYGTDTWDLGNLSPGVEQDITVTGQMVDAFEGEQKTFHVTTGSQSDTDKTTIGVVYNTLDQSVSISQPFIEAKLFVNGVYQDEYASDSKTPIEGEIQWTNNLDTPLDNVQIVATISGNAVDPRSIDAQGGFFNSVNNTITWDKNFLSKFAEIDPGDSGAVDFLLSPLASVDVLSNPEIDISVSISGQQPLEGNTTKQLVNSESKVIRIISDAGLATKALYFSGPFKNTGPIPPVAEQETTYTIVWTLSNSSNDISQAQVVSSLPPWVRFVGAVSPSTEDVSYDDTSQQIVWNVGSIPAGTGLSGASREVSFQVAITPSLSQVNQSPALINDAVLTGYDNFAKVNIKLDRPALDTNLTNDPAFPADGGNVKDPGNTPAPATPAPVTPTPAAPTN